MTTTFTVVSLLVLFISLLHAYDIEPCIDQEQKIFHRLKEMNSFGPERKELLKKIKVALSLEGFTDEQTERMERVRLLSLQEFEHSEREYAELLKQESKKYCQTLLDEYLKNCDIQLKSMMRRKSPVEIRLSMKKVLDRHLNRQFGRRGSKDPKLKARLETLRTKLFSLAEQREWREICDQLSTQWYRKGADVYRSDMDQDEDDDYYPYPTLPLKKSQLNKLTNAQLRQIIKDRGQVCRGCRNKRDFAAFVEQIQRASAIKNLDKISKFKGKIAPPQDTDDELEIEQFEGTHSKSHDDDLEELPKKEEL